MVGVVGWRFELKVGVSVQLTNDVWVLWSAAMEAWGCVGGKKVWGRERRQGCQHVE